MWYQGLWIFLWRIYGLPLWIYEGCLQRFGLGLQCGTEVSSGSLLSILKERYLLKRREVIVTNLNVIAELFLKFLRKSYRVENCKGIFRKFSKESLFYREAEETLRNLTGILKTC